MTYRPPSLLNDLLAADAQACAHGCCLEPRLVEMLLDRHACLPGNGPDITAPARYVRNDGAPQGRPKGLARTGLAALLPPYAQGASHARR